MLLMFSFHGAGGLVGIISVPWFMYVGLERGARGIFWDAHLSIPWLFLGYNLQHHFLVCFLVSSCVWCLEHGADPVPAHMGYHGLGATVIMSGIQEDQSGEPHNNPFEMVPTWFSKLESIYITTIKLVVKVLSKWSSSRFDLQKLILSIFIHLK